MPISDAAMTIRRQNAQHGGGKAWCDQNCLSLFVGLDASSLVHVILRGSWG